MDADEAAALEQFIKDHDTRYVPTANADGSVLLKQVSDGQEVTVHSVAEYEAEFIKGRDPGPTIKAAWEKWMR
jgi:hypothetical protein